MGKIFKLQRPLFGGNLILAYDEDRSHFGQFPVAEEILELFGNEYKIYVLGRVDRDGAIEVKRIVKDRDW